MRIRIYSLFLIAALILSGCASREPQRPADWEESWTMVSPLLAIGPLPDFSLNEANDTLSVSGIYYATWVTGDGRSHTNEDGESATVYDAQIYVLVQEFRTAERAEAEAAQWAERAKQSYETAPEADLEQAGQPYTLLPLVSGSASNPYGHGIAAYAIRGEYAVWVELLCAPDYKTDPRQVMEQFLAGFHYSS